MIQSISDIEEWYQSEDPWGYKESKADLDRKKFLLESLQNSSYMNVLDIGCGNGFVTNALPGETVVGVDISENAIMHARRNAPSHVIYEKGSIFDLNFINQKFDLIIITGVLYPHYIGNSSRLIFDVIDKLLLSGGELVTVHIDDWCDVVFPYYKVCEEYYSYHRKEGVYTHKLVGYIK